MHEDVFAGLRGDKAKALLGVEPFHGSNSHVLVPPSMVLEVSIYAGANAGVDGKGQARPASLRSKNVNLCRATVAGAAAARYQPRYQSMPPSWAMAVVVPAPPAGRVATVGRDREGVLVPAADEFRTGDHVRIVPAHVQVPGWPYRSPWLPSSLANASQTWAWVAFTSARRRCFRCRGWSVPPRR
jgi:hypothetical protein